MNTEITDNKKPEGIILYDADCAFCTGLAKRFRGMLAHRHLELLPLQTPWVRNTLDLADAELLSEMRLLKRDGSLFGGADALLEIGRHFWWTWPLRQLYRIPAARHLLRQAYRWVAERRQCTSGACPVALATKKNEKHRAFDFFPLVILPLLALPLQAFVAPWVFMWLMALAIFYGCKWLTLRAAIRPGLRPRLGRRLAYLFAWPGMDAAGFFTATQMRTATAKREWILAATKTILGAMLLWGMARLALSEYPLLAGWIGMLGVIFLLHFGAFHLLCLAWRRTGVNATPLMRNPLRSESLADFWGSRWNTAFYDLAFRFLFRPLRRRTTPGTATLLVFGVSGCLHELVISLPAHGGYGLPTLYFLTQGLGMQIQRSRLGQSFGLTRGRRGWFFTLLVTAGPAFWLFHPPFVYNVILPMLTAIGAT